MFNQYSSNHNFYFGSKSHLLDLQTNKASKNSNSQYNNFYYYLYELNKDQDLILDILNFWASSINDGQDNTKLFVNFITCLELDDGGQENDTKIVIELTSDQKNETFNIENFKDTNQNSIKIYAKNEILLPRTIFLSKQTNQAILKANKNVIVDFYSNIKFTQQQTSSSSFI